MNKQERMHDETLEEYVFRSSMMVGGRRIYAKQYGKKAFKIKVKPQ